ncbi:MAG: hypothetical protein Kow0098_08710 [Ignavibacteriaceae bacterium]
MKSGIKSYAVYLAVLVFLSLLILAGGYFYFRNEHSSIKSHKEKDLANLNYLLARQILDWHNDQINDAMLISRNQLILRYIDILISGTEDSQVYISRLKDQIREIKAEHDYYSIAVYSDKGKPLFDQEEEFIFSNPPDLNLLHTAIKTDSLVYSDFLYSPETNRVFLDYLSPFHTKTTEGIIVFRSDLTSSLLPIIERFREEKKSETSVLVEKHRNRLLLLNQLSADKKFNSPIIEDRSDKDDLINYALTGKEGIYYSRDHSGTEVISHIIHLENTNWFLITKVDESDVLSDFNQRLGISILIFLLILISFAAILFSVQRNQKAKYLQEQLMKERKENLLKRHYEYLTRYANDIIILIDENGYICEVNDRAVEVYGYSKEELLSMSVTELRAGKDKLSREEVLTSLEKSEGKLYEVFHKKKNGSVFLAEASVRSIVNEGKKYYQGILRDITERKATEKKILRLNRLYSVLSQVNFTIVKEKNPEVLLSKICDLLIDVGKFKMAWIGEYDPASEKIIPAYYKGVDKKFWDDIDINLKDEFWRTLPVSRALLENIIVTENNIGEFLADEKKKNLLLEENINAVTSTPLTLMKNKRGVLSIYASEVDFFKEDEINLIREIASDISFALSAIEVEEIRKANEKLIRENERKLRTLMHNLPGMVYRCRNDKHWTMEFISEGSIELTGYKPEELIENRSVSYSAIIVPEDRQSVSDLIQKAIEEKEIFTLSYRIITKDGSIKWLWERGTAVFEEDGSVTALEGFISDITELKRAEQELLLSNDILKNIGNIVIVSDIDGNIIFISPSVKSIIGYEPSELLGNKWWRVTKADPQDIILAKQEVISKIKNKEQKEFMPYYMRFRCKDGSIKLLLWKDSHGPNNTLIGVASDVTDLIETEKALKESEERFRRITENAEDIIYKFNYYPKPEFEYISPAVEKILGYKPEELYKDQKLAYSTISPQDLLHIDSYRSSSTGTIRNMELKVRRKDGNYVWMDIRNVPVYDDNNRLISIEGIARDITDFKKVQLAIIEAKEKAEEANRLKSNFLANMSHELRTPMIGILGYTELLMNEVNDDEKKEMLSIIYKSSKRLNQTLNSILDLSRIESEKIALQPERFKLPEALKECYELFSPAAKEKKLTYEMVVNNENIFLETDKSLLIKSVNNILSNAIIFTDKGFVRLTCSSDHQFAIISIADSGKGIDSKYLDIIFEPFRQVSEGLSRSYEGTGLGLTITRKFVEFLGGLIEVSSAPGMGSTFTIKIPLVNDYKGNNIISVLDNINSEKNYHTAVKEIRYSRSEYNLPAILLVEDDEMNRNVISRYLKGFFHLDMAESGEEALKKADGKIFDLVLMDIGLGGNMNGLEVTKILRTKKGYENVPIVAVTAFAMVGDRERFIQHGCTHYISKPFTKNEIISLLNTILNPVK